MGGGQMPGMGMPYPGGGLGGGKMPGMGMPYPGGGMGGGRVPGMGMPYPGGGMGGGQMPGMGMPYPGGGMGGGQVPGMGMLYPGGGMGGGQMPGMGMPNMGGGIGMGQQMPGMPGIGMDQMQNFTGNYAGQIAIGGRQFNAQLMLQQQGAQIGGQVVINEFGGQPIPIVYGMIQNNMLNIAFSSMGSNGMVAMVLGLMPGPNGLQGMAGDALTNQYGQAVFQRIQ